MAGFSNYYATLLLKKALGKADFTMPTNIYLALFTADPTDAGLMTNELPNLNGYTRLDITTLIGTVVDGACQNSALIQFPTATADWAQVTHAMLTDSGTHGAGNSLFTEALLDTKTTLSGTNFEIDIGNFSIFLD